MNYRNEVTWIIPEACHLFHYIVSPVSSGLNYRNEVTWIMPGACTRSKIRRFYDGPINVRDNSSRSVTDRSPGGQECLYLPIAHIVPYCGLQVLCACQFFVVDILCTIFLTNKGSLLTKL